MHYYQIAQSVCATEEALPYPGLQPAAAQPTVYLFRRDGAHSRGAFCVSDPRQLTAKDEDVSWLDPSRMPPQPALPQPVTAACLGGGLRAVNLSWPGWENRLAPVSSPGKKRLHILALGDVGSTIAMALRLLGGDVLHTVGICDVRPETAARWEFELNQATEPWHYDAMPEVKIVPPAEVFDCDVFVFAASKGVPPVGAAGDVRMAQLEANRGLIAQYARQARQAGFRGLFAVVSDPVDPLARAAFLASNTDDAGVFDGKGLLPEQISGFGLGVMNARAAYYAKKDPAFASFLTEGRAFGPHGQGLVIANSIAAYDDGLSCRLTELAVTANQRMRELGFKPYVAPALSSAALSLLLTLRGQWHYSSVFLGGVYFGVKNRFTPRGIETEGLPLPDALYRRLEESYASLLRIR